MKTARTTARQLRRSIELWLFDAEEGDCPALSTLISDGVVDEDVASADPWGREWRIACEGTKVEVCSFGPDRKERGGDDICAPPKG